MKLVAISGPSCCGKSTLARHLQLILPNIILVYEDDFYYPDSDIPFTDGIQNWDCPAAFDLNRLREFLTGLKRSGGQVPSEFHSTEQYNDRGENLLTGEELSSLRAKYSGLKDHIIIVDGIMLFHGDSPLWDLFDIKILFGSSHDELLARREARSAYVTSEGRWEDPPGYFDNIVWPEFKKEYGYLYGPDGGLSDVAIKKGIHKPPTTIMPKLLEWVISLIPEKQQ